MLRRPGDGISVALAAVVVPAWLVFAVVWAGGSAACALIGRDPDPTPPFAAHSLITLVTGGPAALWPATPAAAVWTGIGAVGALTALPVLTGLGWAARWLIRPAGLASPWEMRRLTARRMRRRCARLAAGGAFGYRLARLGRHDLYASVEDSVLALMGTRSGKTAAIATPMLLEAAGPALATSVRPDLYLLTATARGRRGRVWAFDPQAIAHLPRTWTWDMIGGIASYEQAVRLAGHFAATKGDAEKAETDFWLGSARSLLAGLLFAAALDRRAVADVLRWLGDPADPEPVSLLRRHAPALAESMRARTTTAADTREGVYQTARECVAALLDPQIAAWVTPDEDRPVFDPAVFASRGHGSPGRESNEPARDLLKQGF